MEKYLDNPINALMFVEYNQYCNVAGEIDKRITDCTYKEPVQRTIHLEHAYKKFKKL